MDHIHIFRTDITDDNLSRLQKIFSSIRQILQWNVDTDDCDRVLRVVSYELSGLDIIDLVVQNGFLCEELS